MTQSSPPKLYTDVEEKLGEPLAQFVNRYRATGTSWRRIAVEITTRTQIDITGETLRVWSQGRAPVLADSSSTPSPGAPAPTPVGPKPGPTHPTPTHPGPGRLAHAAT